MGEIGRIKLVNSHKAFRQAWFRGSAPQMPMVPKQISAEIHTSALIDPLRQAHPSLLPARVQGGTRMGEGRGFSGVEAQMGRRDKKRLEAVHRRWRGWASGMRLCSQPGSARDGSLLLFTRPAAPLAWPPSSATSAAPARGPQGRSWGWEGGPTAGAGARKDRVCARGAKEWWRLLRLRKVGPSSTCARTGQVSVRVDPAWPAPLSPPRPAPGAPSPSDSSRSARSP